MQFPKARVELQKKSLTIESRDREYSPVIIDGAQIAWHC